MSWPFQMGNKFLIFRALILLEKCLRTLCDKRQGIGQEVKRQRAKIQKNVVGLSGCRCFPVKEGIWYSYI